MKRHVLSVAIALGICLTKLAPSAQAKTYVIPHVFEQKGRISTTPFVFDTTIFASFGGRLADTDGGSSATITIYLYDPSTDAPLVSATGENVCNPCLATLDATHRKVGFNLEDIIEAAGGFERDLQPLYAIVVVDGDEDNVGLQGFVVNSHTDAFDLSVFGFEPQPVAAAARTDGRPPRQRRAFVLPHVLERSGRISDTPFTFDTTLFVTYAGGLQDAPPGDGATVELYLLDGEDSHPLVSASGEDVCNPCSFEVGRSSQGTPGRRKLALRIEDLIEARGGPAAKDFQGSALLVVKGDADNVNVEGFVVNSHTSAFDLTAEFVSPLAVQSVDRDPGDPPPDTRKTYVIPHVFEQKGRISTTPYVFDTTLFLSYTAGRGGIPEGSGAVVDISLHDVTTGELLRDRNGGTVCGPCSITLGRADQGLAPRQQIAFDLEADLEDGLHDVSAVIDVQGDQENVSIQGFVVNSHTSAFDLAFAAVPAQEVGPSKGEGDPVPDTRKTYVIPHVFEQKGRIASTQGVFDSSLTVALAPQLDLPGAQEDVTIEIHLYDGGSGQYLKSKNGAAVCGPCEVTLGAARQAARLDLEALVEAAGGLDDTRPFVFGHGIVVVPSDQVAMQGYVVNSHTSPFDLSVFGFEPVPIAAARLSGPRFQRGDTNSDGKVDIGDPINTLSYLFQGSTAPGCLKTADSDGRTGIDISDAVYLLQFQFLGGSPPAPPFPGCGRELTPTDVPCEAYAHCP